MGPPRPLWPRRLNLPHGFGLPVVLWAQGSCFHFRPRGVIRDRRRKSSATLNGDICECLRRLAPSSRRMPGHECGRRGRLAPAPRHGRGRQREPETAPLGASPPRRLNGCGPAQMADAWYFRAANQGARPSGAVLARQELPGSRRVVLSGLGGMGETQLALLAFAGL
jgi:hypothetical protein